MKNWMSVVVTGAVAGGLVLLAQGTASAGTPVWCKDAGPGSPDMSSLSSKDPRDVVKAFVAAECSPNQEVEANRAQIEQARAAWGKRLNMTEADWADAAAWVKKGGDREIRDDIDLSSNDLSAATPIDQFMVIRADGLYAADMFDANLSEVGRYALLRHCLSHDASEVSWAVCQPDFDKFDMAKFSDQLRGDTAHDGDLRMRFRLAVFELPAELKDHAAEVAKLHKHDDTWKKMWELAAKSRGDWQSANGGNAKLLALVLKMESGHRAKSRKMMENCDADTYAALGEAVAKLPAKTFDKMKDERMDPYKGFASKAMPILVKDPQFHLAAIAVALCKARPGLADMLANYIQNTWGERGPRAHAFQKIADADMKLDKLDEHIRYPRHHEYVSRSGGAVSSTGSVIKSVKKTGDFLTVSSAPLMVTQVDCVASHTSNKIDTVRDGKVTYQRDCDKTAVVAHDNSWGDYKVALTYASILKPGTVISTASGGNGVPEDVIAVWPTQSSLHPSWMYGAAVK